MKYLKGFFSKKEAPEYYKKIDLEEYRQSVGKVWLLDLGPGSFIIKPPVPAAHTAHESMTKIELSEISNILKGYSNDDRHFSKNGNLRFVISKLKDEWFYVYVAPGLYTREEWYKCDQIDGLLELLKTFTNRIW